MPLASVMLDEARVLLNDQGAKLYRNSVILPILRKAYRELQQNLADNGVSVSREQSANIAIPAASVTIEFGTAPPPELPSTLLYPISLQEKISGEDDKNFIPMTERTWLESQDMEERLRFWSWRDDTIQLIGSTVATVVRIRFWGSLTAIVDDTTNVPILDSETFLAARTAAIAAFVIGGSSEKADPLQSDADVALDLLLSRAVKNRQNQPTRRRRFQAFRNRQFWR